ncbi:MAG: pantetheine-phosphate adenylyltransferase, partial [Thermoplasmatota archaeon]
MRVCLGGTFDRFHKGHRALLDTALDAAGPSGHVFVGVTTDAFAARGRDRAVRPYAERAAHVINYVRGRPVAARSAVREGEDANASDASGRVTIAPIDEPLGAVASLAPETQAIAVTRETAPTAERINAERAKRRLPPLKIVIAPWILADDGLPLKATRVAAGEIDEEGRLARPPRVALGSANPAKLAATRTVFARAWPGATVVGLEVDSKVAPQPIGADTWRGARERAHAALARDAGAVFGVGIEAGLLRTEGADRTFDVQACVIVDRGGRETHGHGAGFTYPPDVEARILAGDAT